jgi:hypothetical protein
MLYLQEPDPLYEHGVVVSPLAFRRRRRLADLDEIADLIEARWFAVVGQDRLAVLRDGRQASHGSGRPFTVGLLSCHAAERGVENGYPAPPHVDVGSGHRSDRILQTLSIKGSEYA